MDPAAAVCDRHDRFPVMRVLHFSGICRRDHLAGCAAASVCRRCYLRDLPARAAMAAARNTTGASADPARTESRKCPGRGLGYPGGTFGGLRCNVLVTWCQWKISSPRQDQLAIQAMPLTRITPRGLGRRMVYLPAVMRSCR